MFKRIFIIFFLFTILFSFIMPVLAKNAQDWIEEGILFYQDGRFFEAGYCFDRALELEPDNKEAMEWK